MPHYLTSELHVHSCLSPCASLDMSPLNIFKKAQALNIEILALTDHNSALNCPALAELTGKSSITFLPGMEVTTREEVHIICLFHDTAAALDLGAEIYQRLPDISDPGQIKGDQLQVNSHDEIISEIEKYLNLAADISIAQLVEYVHQLQGLVIPAHIDRAAYGIMETLGFLPNYDFDALELSPHFFQKGLDQSELYQPLLKEYFCYQSSDAHYPQDIGKCQLKLNPDDPILRYLSRP